MSLIDARTDAETSDLSADAAGTRQRAVDRVVASLGRRRFPITREEDTQEGIAETLDRFGILYERERRLSVSERIDFYLPDHRIGLEVKVAGSPVGVIRQLQRYAASDEVALLMLVTSRGALGRAVPETLLGKPVVVVELWRSML